MAEPLSVIFVKGARRDGAFFQPSIFHLSQGSDFLHYHDMLELGVCLNGSGKYLTVDCETPFEAGDVQVILPFSPHYNIANEGGSLWAFVDVDVPRINSPHVSIDPAYFLSLARNTAASGIYTAKHHPDVASAVRAIVGMMQSEQSMKSPAVDLIAAKLGTLLLELLTLDENGSGTVEIEEKSKTLLPAIHLASEAIEHGRRVSPSDMANACFMSESYFRKIFSRVMGEPPKRYLLRLQMQRAAALLMTTTLSVGEVAKRVSMEDASTFYRCFVKTYGLSPAAYRRGADKAKPLS